MFKKKFDKKAGATVGAMVLVVGVVLILGAMVGYAINDLKYKNSVHSYVENARWSMDPVYIKENLTKAIAGMHELNLNDNMNSELFMGTSATTMKMQYAQMNQAITQCDALIAANLTDASYGSMLNNLHNMIYDNNGWIDEVAQSAFDTNYNMALPVILGVLGIICLVIAFVVWIN